MTQSAQFSDEQSLLIKEYYSSSLYNTPLLEPTISYQTGNDLCDDSITVDLIIDTTSSIHAYGFSGNVSLITKAAASFLGDLIIDMPIKNVLTLSYTSFSHEGFVVSLRRKNSAVLALLAVRNAIHQYLGDGIQDTLDDLTEE